MSEESPDLLRVIGAMIFAAGRPLSLKDMRRVLRQVGEESEGPARAFKDVGEPEIAAAVEALIVDFDSQPRGLALVEVAGGFRFQSDPECGLWLRRLLDKGQPSRLSQPALETLAVIAYRQPATRAQIEAIGGVGVGHVLRMLLELQLVRIAGRSELPGRPFQYGTTPFFLEHFGLRSLDHLEEINPSLVLKHAAPQASAPAREIEVES